MDHDIFTIRNNQQSRPSTKANPLCSDEIFENALSYSCLNGKVFQSVDSLFTKCCGDCNNKIAKVVVECCINCDEVL